MESFSLLKYWRASSSTTTTSSSIAVDGGGASSTTNASSNTTTIASSASSPDSRATEAAATEGGGEEEGGSFFDLEFASVPDEEDESDSISESDVEEGGEPNGKQIFTSLVSLETLNAAAAAADAAKSPHHSPVSLLKSATRLRVFALALNKRRLKSDANVVDSPKSSGSSSSSNFFIEVFTGSRNNSSKSKAPDDEDSTEERKFSKDVVHKYINSKIKPLYFRVSRRYGGDRMRFSGPLTAAGGDAASKKKKKVMVKSRSAVAAVTSTPPPPAAAVQRRDDSLLQQEDGIQSAIAHCKQSLNASSKETKALVVDEGGEGMV